MEPSRCTRRTESGGAKTIFRLTSNRARVQRMPNFILRTDAHKAHCLETIANLSPGKVWEVEVREYTKSRTLPQNSRYWASLTQCLKEIADTANRVSDATGYTPLEVKRLIAKEMEPEYIAILYARSPEVAHDVIKAICNVPTSVRLGTKEFSKFDETMERTIAEIVGQIQAFERMAG